MINVPPFALYLYKGALILFDPKNFNIFFQKTNKYSFRATEGSLTDANEHKFNKCIEESGTPAQQQHGVM